MTESDRDVMYSSLILVTLLSVRHDKGVNKRLYGRLNNECVLFLSIKILYSTVRV